MTWGERLKTTQRKKFKNVSKYIFRDILLFVILTWAVFPVFWMFLMSLKRTVDALAMPPKWIFQPILDNYVEVFALQRFTQFYVNSLVVGFASVALVLIIGVPASYTLSRISFKGKKNVDFWILTTRMAPPIGVLIPFFLIFRTLNLLDTKIALIAMHVAINLPFAIWIMKGFFAEVPKEIEEASLIDGCSYWKSFLRITLPLVLPGVAATAIIVFLLSWNELLFAVTLTGLQSKTAPVALYNFVSYEEISWGPLSASAIVALVPVILFIILLQKQLIRGLTFGAISK